MARNITNFAELSDPITASIDANTMAMTDIAACQAAGISSIYNTPLNCGAEAPDASSLQPVVEDCCRDETLTDTPSIGDMTVRTTCSDGSVTDVVTYENGDVCTFQTMAAAPSAATVVFDENCQAALTDVVTACKARILGQPYSRYFIPLASDFGNQVYCVPDATYAFAWSGVMNINIIDFLEQNQGAIDLEDPTNQYVAVVEGEPYFCPDPTVPGNELDELQISQQRKLGVYSPLLNICEAWDGVGEDAAVEPPGEDGILNLLGLCDVQTPEVDGKTLNEAYMAMWKDYWQCEKKGKTVRNALLAVQGATALAGLVTSIQTYNDILDKNLDILCNVADDVDLLAACNAALLGTEEEPGILKQCQATLLEGHNDRIGTINNRAQAFCDFADDEIDCYEQMWRPIVKEYTPKIASELQIMLNNGKLSSEYTTSWADGLQACVTENMLPELKRQFAPLISSSNCAAQNLNDWRDELKRDADALQDHFNKVYKPGEVKTIPAIMDMSACMVQKVCELRDWLYDCARASQCVYENNYQQGEGPQARAAMAAAAQLIPKVIETVNWLDINIPAATEIFRCYKEGMDYINPRLFDNAGDLAEEIQVCYKEFRDMSHYSRERYRKIYEKREYQLVHAQMDLAITVTDMAKDSICRLNNWSEQDRKMYDDNFRSLEIEGATDLVLNGQNAANDVRKFSDWFDERTKEYHDIYHSNWLPCDIENLKQHCAMWESVNPLQEMHRNADNMQDMSVQATELYEKGLLHAEHYMDQVFKEQDRFDFCIEDPAVHHVRRRIDKALEDLDKCTSKYATGHLAHQRMVIKAAGAQAEGGAYAAANRFKWWANEQLEQRDFERRTAVLGAMDTVAARGLAGNAASTAAQDGLLTHMREAITRGALYTGNMQDAGRATTTLKGNEVDAMLRMIQLWHFWPELAANESTQTLSAINQVHAQAAQLVQLGHFWPGQAMQEKMQAVDVAESAIATGVQLTQIGQYYLSQADQMNTQRAAVANQSGALGNQFANTGHNLHRLATDKVSDAMQQSIAAGGLGVQAGQLGQAHMATALEMENRMTLNALEHVRAGITAFAAGVDILGETRQTQALAGSYGLPAAEGLLQLFNTGRNQSLIAMEANQQCKNTEFEMLCKAKDFVMNNYRTTGQLLHNGTTGTLNAGNNLLNGQGQNAAGAFGLLGNSLEGLIGNNFSSATPPLPTGGSLFGGGGGFGGFG